MDIFVKATEVAGHGVEYLSQADFELHPCPICGSVDYLQPVAEVRAGDGTAVESVYCTSCEHRYHRKFPTKEWLQAYYQEKFDKLVGSAKTTPGVFSLGYQRLRSRVGKFVRHGVAQNIPNRIFDFMLGAVKGDSAYYLSQGDIHRVLEIGCGRGDNLAYFRDKGFDVFGTEVSHVRLAECAAKGLSVFATGIDNFDAVSELAPFDFVYSTHVLEHVINVNRHVQMVSELLRPGGFAYIETPDLSGESLLYQTHSIYHVHTFSLASMLRLLARHGLQAVRVAADGNVQVLVKKMGAVTLPLLSGRAFPDSSLPYLQAMARNSSGGLRLEWDHYQMTISTLEDGRQVFQSGLRPLSVRLGPNRYRMDCQVANGHSDEQVFPVRIIYPNLISPPIWYKI